MLKKLRLLALVFGMIVSIVWLGACSTSSSMAWLKGSWYSEDWKATYTIEEVDGKWTVMDSGEPLVEQAELTEKGADMLLTDSGNIAVQIEKVNDEEIKLNYYTTDGSEGATASVTFIKVEE
ncbi:TPA: hypothetical protein ACGO0F_000901 [Streptococcus suis]